MSSSEGIRLEEVSKSFRRARVLDAVSLRIPPGERVALVGPNGAGKTTLIRCLLGEYACGGRVSLGSLAPRTHRTEVLRRIGFVPQLPPPLKMPVAQLLGFAARLCDADVKEMEAYASQLGLEVECVRRQPFAKLSGGQKQKLLIAIALRDASELLILDEPAANLDPEARRVFFGLLAGRAEGTTMLISSHRLDEVAGLVGRVVELDRGRIAMDERVAGAGALHGTLRCRIRLERREPSAVRTLEGWGLQAASEGDVFEGRVAGPDRLRFFGMLARYSGLIADLRLEDDDASPR